VVYENERVRVLEYTDTPGDTTTPHERRDGIMYTQSSFRRRLLSGETHRDVKLKDAPAQPATEQRLGPSYRCYVLSP